MSDNVSLQTGTGGSTFVVAADAIGGVNFQRVKLNNGADGVDGGDVCTANPLPVTAATLPLPTGAATVAAQETGNTSIASIDTKTPSLGQALAAASVPVVLTTSQLTTLTPPAAITGFSTEAKQPALGTAGTASSDVITVQGITSMTPLSVIGTVAFSNSTIAVSGGFIAATQSGTWTVGLSAGSNSIGKLASNTGVTIGAVEIASSQTVGIAAGSAVIGHVIVDSGTITTVTAVTAITNALPAGTNTIGNTIGVPATSGGLSMSKTVSASSTNATSVKASAGQVYSIQVFNINAAARYLKLYDKASSPTVGSDTPVKTILIPGNTAGGGVVLNQPMGLAFATGIAFALTTGIGDSDTGAVAASDLAVNIDYK